MTEHSITEKYFADVRVLDIMYHYVKVGSPYPERRSVYLHPKELDVEGLKQLISLLENKLNELPDNQQFYCKYCLQDAQKYYDDIVKNPLRCFTCSGEVEMEISIKDNIVSYKPGKCKVCGEDNSYRASITYKGECLRHFTFNQGTSIYQSNHDINIIATISSYTDFAIGMEYGKSHWELYINNNYAILERPNGLTFKANSTSLNGKNSSYAKCLRFVLEHLKTIKAILEGNKEYLQVGGIFITVQH